MELQTKMSKSLDEIFSTHHLHQTWEVESGFSTPGRNPIELILNKCQIPNDLTGKSVLDVGAWNGCYSFECEKRGAQKVVAADLWNPDYTGFNDLKRYLNSQVTYEQISVYDLSSEQLGEFDIVFFFGVLYHLRHPLLALDRLRTVCKGELYLESHLVTNRLFLRTKRWLGLFFPIVTICEFLNIPLWRYYKSRECHPKDPSNWFGPNIPAVLEALESSGFHAELLATWSRDHKARNRRGAFRARISENLNIDRMDGTQEALSPLNEKYTFRNIKKTEVPSEFTVP